MAGVLSPKTSGDDVDLGSGSLKFGAGDISVSGPAMNINTPGIFSIDFDGVPKYAWQPTIMGPTTPMDGLIDLGATNAQFKDLYLSGDANVGGTVLGDTLAINAAIDHTLTDNSGILTITNPNQDKNLVLQVNHGGSIETWLMLKGIGVAKQVIMPKFLVWPDGADLGLPANNELGTFKSNTADYVRFIVSNDGTGDVQFSFQLAGQTKWSVGADNSDGDSFKISTSTNLGTNTAVEISRGTLDWDFKGGKLLTTDSITCSAFISSGDPDTQINFNPDEIIFLIGGQNAITITEAATDTITMKMDTIIEDDDLYFVGNSSGLPYGSIYNDNIGADVIIATAGTFVVIDEGWTVGFLNLATFTNGSEITVTKAGRYKIDYSISFNSDGGAGLDMEGAIGINSTKNAQGTSHRLIGAGNDIGNIGGTAILDLAANAVVSLMMTNNTNTVNIMVTHASLSLTMVGGT